MTRWQAFGYGWITGSLLACVACLAAIAHETHQRSTR